MLESETMPSRQVTACYNDLLHGGIIFSLRLRFPSCKNSIQCCLQNEAFLLLPCGQLLFDTSRHPITCKISKATKHPASLFATNTSAAAATATCICSSRGEGSEYEATSPDSGWSAALHERLKSPHSDAATTVSAFLVRLNKSWRRKFKLFQGRNFTVSESVFLTEGTHRHIINPLTSVNWTQFLTFVEIFDISVILCQINLLCWCVLGHFAFNSFSVSNS